MQTTISREELVSINGLTQTCSQSTTSIAAAAFLRHNGCVMIIPDGFIMDRKDCLPRNIVIHVAVNPNAV